MTGRSVFRLNSKTAVVQGQSEFQQINFTIPGIEKICQLRIDLGYNKNQSPIEIQAISLSTRNSRITYKEDLFTIFQPNYCLYRQGSTLTPFIFEKVYDPFLTFTGKTETLNSLYIGRKNWNVLRGVCAFLAFTFFLYLLQYAPLRLHDKQTSITLGFVLIF